MALARSDPAVQAMDRDRARSLPPMEANPWWSDKLKAEFQLRRQRPEDLPVPHDGDGDLEEPELMPVEGVGGLRSGKGQGELSQSSGGRMFVTPPSGRAEGRGSVKGKRSEGMMPTTGSSKVDPTASMGPLPPEHRPPRRDEAADNLQKALEAEMVIFLREQNAQLLVEGVSKMLSCW